MGPPLLRVGLLRAPRSLAGLQQQRADGGPHLQLAGLLEERRHGHRLLHPGRLVDESPDAQPRRPLRQIRGHTARPVEPGWHVRRGAHGGGERSDQPEHRRVAPWRLVRPDRQRPHCDQVQLQPLRPAGGHRPRHQRQPADRRLGRLPVDRSEWQPQVRCWRNQPGDLPGVQRRHVDQLRARRGLAVLGRGDGGRGNAAARPGPRRRDVLLPHQPQADRPAQHAGADQPPTRSTR